jgi:hypothetical protein
MCVPVFTGLGTCGQALQSAVAHILGYEARRGMQLLGACVRRTEETCGGDTSLEVGAGFVHMLTHTFTHTCAGHQIGSILSLLFSPLLIASTGVDAMFYVYGLMGFVWIALWDPLVSTQVSQGLRISTQGFNCSPGLALITGSYRC